MQTVGHGESLSPPKEDAKDDDAIINRTKSDLEVFQLQLGKFKSSLYEKFSSFKHSFITEVSQFKGDFLCQKSTRNDQKSFFMEKLLHQMEKEINFLHEKLKSKNTIITLLLEKFIKLKIIITMKTGASIRIMMSKLLSRKKITLNQLNQLKQWKEKSRQQNH